MRLANSLAYGGMLQGGKQTAAPRPLDAPDGLHELASPHLTGRRSGWWPARALIADGHSCPDPALRHRQLGANPGRKGRQVLHPPRLVGRHSRSTAAANEPPDHSAARERARARRVRERARRRPGPARRGDGHRRRTDLLQHVRRRDPGGPQLGLAVGVGLEPGAQHPAAAARGGRTRRARDRLHPRRHGPGPGPSECGRCGGTSIELRRRKNGT